MNSIDILKNNNLKVTKQRLEVLDMINILGIDSSIKNISNRITNMDKSTIYRILNILYENGILEKIIGKYDQIIYVISDEHKHYMKCLKCGSITEIDKCPFDNNKNNSYIDGFKVIRHSLIIEGICKNCQ